jgi:hypothetical protein
VTAPTLIKPIDNQALINVLCMTRGRPDNLVQAIESAAERVSDPDNVAMWIYVDDDDAATLALIETGWHRSIPFPIHWLVLPRPSTLPEGLNELWRRSSNAAFYMGFPDDYTIVTDNWDAIIRTTMAQESSDGMAIGYLCDPLEPNANVTFMIETAQWVNYAGQFLFPYFPFWFSDLWLQQIADMVDRRIYIDVGVLPMDGSKGKTQTMWDLYFWRRFFHILLVERVDTAQWLLDYIHPPNSPSREGALKLMKARIEEIEGNQRRVPNIKLNAVEAKISGEKGPPSERYLAALQSAKEHLRTMAPRIKQYRNERLLRDKIRMLFDEIET